MYHKITLDTAFQGYPSITAEIHQLVRQSGVAQGVCILSLPHTTAGLCITSFWDPRGLDDLVDELGRSFPPRVGYRHQDSPYDAGGHVKSAFIGTSAMLLIKDSKLLLGSSQGLVLLEFDGPRPRECHVVIHSMPVQVYPLHLQTAYMGMHDITPQVGQAVAQSGIQEGLCHVSMLHSTAGLLCASGEPGALCGLMEDIERMVPTRVDFKHRETASDAGGHVKTAFAGSQLSFPVHQGKLCMGKGQRMIFAEFDGPRPRSFLVGVLAATGGGPQPDRS